MNNLKKNRFYSREFDERIGDCATVILPNKQQIEYSFLCTQPNHFPPKGHGYKLVYETDTEDFSIIPSTYDCYDIKEL